VKNKYKIYWILGAVMLLFITGCNISSAGWIAADTITSSWCGDSSSSIVWMPSSSRVYIAYYDIYDQLWGYRNIFPRKGSGAWSNPVIDDNSGVGKSLSLAVSPTNGNAYVAYYYQLTTNLKYATAYPDYEWDSITLHTSAGDIGWNPSMCFDSSGNSYVTYLDSSTCSVLLIDRFATPLAVDGSALGNSVGMYSSVGFTGSNVPLIAYYDQGNKRLKLADKYGGEWNRRVIDSGDVGEYPAMGVNGETFYIAYKDNPKQAVVLAYGNTTSWNTKVIDASGDGTYTHIVVIPGAVRDTICIVYQGIGPNGLSVLMAKSTNSGASFNTEVVAHTPGKNISAWKTGTNEIIVWCL